MESYDALIQLFSGLLLVAVVILPGRPQAGLSRGFRVISGIFTAALLLIAIKEEEWRLLALAAGAAGKGALLPYLLKRLPKEPGAPEEPSSPGGLSLLGAALAAAALLFGRELSGMHHLSGDAMGAAGATVLAGLLLLATRRQLPAQLLALGLLEEGILFGGAVMSPAVPVAGLALDLAILFLLGWLWLAGRPTEGDRAKEG